MQVTEEQHQTNLILIFRITIIKTTFFKTVVNDLTEEGERVKKTTFWEFFSFGSFFH